MNKAVGGAFARLEGLDRRGDWRRFWWVVPPLGIALSVWAGLGLYHHFTDQHLITLHEVVSQSYNTSASPRLSIDDLAGNVVIDTGIEPRVDISITRQGAGTSEQAAFNDLTSLSLQVRNAVGTITIATGQAAGVAPSALARSDIHVTVPPGTHVSVVAHRGNVSTAAVVGDIRASTDHGDIEVRLPAGAHFNLLDGAGALYSEFPLSTPPAGASPGLFATAGGRTDATPQVLDLHAPNGNVRIVRQ